VSQTTTPIRIVLVDDHAMLRRGLAFFLSGFDDLELVGEADSGEQALTVCRQTLPDVVLMDIKMPGLDGAETTRLIREQFPQIQVIVLTSFQEDDLVRRALEAGAIGYLLKDISAIDLARAIRQAHAGGLILAPGAAEALLQTPHQPLARSDYGLTKREQQVLDLLAEGLSNAEIADRLVISLSTAKFHVHSILTKLEVSSRAEAIALAWKHGLIS
jgi:NarL family two-component system response regulator LiaR